MSPESPARALRVASNTIGTRGAGVFGSLVGEGARPPGTRQQGGTLVVSWGGLRGTTIGLNARA